MASALAVVRPILWENQSEETIDGHEFFRTNGIKKNRSQVFEFQLNGMDVYQLIQLLVRGAESAEDFATIRKFVLYADEIQRQAKIQGF